jgi:hypothetical protein
MLNPNLTYSDAKWLWEEYQPMMSHRIDRGSIEKHLKAYNLMLDKQATIPSCSCQYTSAAKVTQSVFSQYKNEIEKLYTNGEQQGIETLQTGS